MYQFFEAVFCFRKIRFSGLSFGRYAM